MAESSLAPVALSIYLLLLYFAIGGGFYTALLGGWTRFKGKTDYLNYIAKNSLFFCCVSLTAGLVTVGLSIARRLGWFSEAVIPVIDFLQRPTVLILLFLQITAAIIYFRQWFRLSAKKQPLWAGIYILTSLLLLFSINQGSFLLLLILRASYCLILAALWFALVAAKEKNIDLKIQFTRCTGWLVLASLFVAIACQLWYYTSFANLTAYWQISIFLSCLLLPMTALGMILFPRSTGYVSAGILLALASAAVVSFEWGYLTK